MNEFIIFSKNYRKKTLKVAILHSLQEHEMEVFYDVNEQHRILAEDVEEYLAPIYSSDAQFVVCVLGPEYPKKVWTKFESKQFKDRFKTGEVIPVVLDTAPLGVFDEASRFGYFSWKTKEASAPQVARLTELLVQKCAARRKS